MIFLDSSLLDQLLEKHLAKAARMSNREANVLIQMKGFHVLPVNLWLLGECLEKFLLRSGGGSDYSSQPTRLYSFAYRVCSLLGRRLAECNLVVKNPEDHGVLSGR